MVEIGIRELKARLSYYVQLMQAGETIAIKVRDRVVGFLSNILPQHPGKRQKRHSREEVAELIVKWRREGFIISGALYRHRSFKPVKLASGPTTTEIIRQMRDEE